MKRNTARSIVHGVTSTPMLMLLITIAAAQSTKLKNVDLCNGVDRTSAEPQIIGCTALIESGLESSETLAIAYNNRGNAYTGKGEYELAVKDYDKSINLNSNNAIAFNNRGVAYKKKSEYDRAINDFSAALKITPNYASAFVNRGETYGKKNDYGRALKGF